MVRPRSWGRMQLATGSQEGEQSMISQQTFIEHNNVIGTIIGYGDTEMDKDVESCSHNCEFES